MASMNRIAFASILLCVTVGAACARSGLTGHATAATAPVAANSARVHRIELPHYQANLPPGEGREAFAANCLSCHSTRYVTMQPASFDEAKWAEEVKKMVKPYGAPIADEQVGPIAQYIVTARRADPGEWDTLSVIAAPAASAVEAGQSRGGHADGQALYVRYCASCHGTDGKGDTVAAGPMLPRPTDLTSGRFAPRAVAAAVTDGVRGTAMPAFPGLSPVEVTHVVEYTQQLGAGESTPPPSSDAEDRVAAQELYRTNCARCHGETGAGDGFAAPPLARVPANFRERQPTAVRAADVIANGVPGTAMPAWRAKLTAAQRSALADYTRTFFDAAPHDR
jgi:mono/diheme cytochrome c family protein